MMPLQYSTETEEWGPPADPQPPRTRWELNSQLIAEAFMPREGERHKKKGREAEEEEEEGICAVFLEKGSPELSVAGIKM